MTAKTKQIELHSDLMLRKEQGTYVAYFSFERFTVNLQEPALTRAKPKALLLYDKHHPATQNTAENDQQTKQLDERTICNGNVVLFLRERSKRWQARIKRYSDSWLQYSTGTADFRKPKANTEARYRDIRWRQDTGKVDISKRFKDVCLVAKNELEKEYDRTKRQQVKDKIRVIDKYLVPYLGNYDTHNPDGKSAAEVCCIYATAPMIHPADIKKLDALMTSRADYAISVTSYAFPIQRATWITDQQRVQMFQLEHLNSRSQDLKETWHDARQFVWGDASAWLSGTTAMGTAAAPLVLPRYRIQDIDSWEDWQHAEALFCLTKR